MRLFSKCGLNHTLLRVQERRACEKWKPMGPGPQEFWFGQPGGALESPVVVLCYPEKLQARDRGQWLADGPDGFTRPQLHSLTWTSLWMVRTVFSSVAHPKPAAQTGWEGQGCGKGQAWHRDTWLSCVPLNWNPCAFDPPAFHPPTLSLSPSSTEVHLFVQTLIENLPRGVNELKPLPCHSEVLWGQLNP